MIWWWWWWWSVLLLLLLWLRWWRWCGRELRCWSCHRRLCRWWNRSDRRRRRRVAVVAMGVDVMVVGVGVAVIVVVVDAVVVVITVVIVFVVIMCDSCTGKFSDSVWAGCQFLSQSSSFFIATLSFESQPLDFLFNFLNLFQFKNDLRVQVWKKRLIFDFWCLSLFLDLILCDLQFVLEVTWTAGNKVPWRWRKEKKENVGTKKKMNLELWSAE